MGCNAIRTSHNPPAPELLDLCDRMGFLVEDEAFDAWKLPRKITIIISCSMHGMKKTCVLWSGVTGIIRRYSCGA